MSDTPSIPPLGLRLPLGRLKEGIRTPGDLAAYHEREYSEARLPLSVRL